MATIFGTPGAKGPPGPPGQIGLRGPPGRDGGPRGPPGSSSTVMGAGPNCPIPDGAFQMIQAVAGSDVPIDVTVYGTTITRDVTQPNSIHTMPDGTCVGQLKLIRVTKDTGDPTYIVPANLSGGTSITMPATPGNQTSRDSMVLLIWNGSAWVVIDLQNITIVP